MYYINNIHGETVAWNMGLSEVIAFLQSKSVKQIYTVVEAKTLRSWKGTTFLIINNVKPIIHTNKLYDNE